MKTNISVVLEKRTDFYSKYSKNKLSNDLSRYIYDECFGEAYKNKIVINIYTRLKLSDEEKQQMMDLVRRNYGLMVQDRLYYHEKDKNLKLVLLVVGIFLIILYYSAVVSILKEIILILGWLAIWESIYGLLFDSSKDQLQIIRLRELARARIYFHDIKELDDNM